MRCVQGLLVCIVSRKREILFLAIKSREIKRNKEKYIYRERDRERKITYAALSYTCWGGSP